jgi:hypothetical protein
VTTFVCCRENPAASDGTVLGKEESDDDVVEAHGTAASTTTTEAAMTTTTPAPEVSTEIVTELVPIL